MWFKFLNSYLVDKFLGWIENHPYMASWLGAWALFGFALGGDTGNWWIGLTTFSVGWIIGLIAAILKSEA